MMERKTQETLIDTQPTFVVAESPKQDLWDTVLDQLDEVARRLDLDPGIHAILRVTRVTSAPDQALPSCKTARPMRRCL